MVKLVIELICVSYSLAREEGVFSPEGYFL